MKQQLHFWRFLATSLFLAFSIFSWAYDFVSGGIYYNINSDKISVTVTYKTSTYNSYSGSVTIPSQVTYNSKTYEVTSIGGAAFYGCSGLTSVTIPNSVTSIGSAAFRDCSGLTSVTIPNSVTSIGRNAFYGTAWFNNQPDGLVYAGKVAYEYKGTMPTGTHITLEEGTLGIGESAFYNCSGLTSVTIPNSVTSIGISAFEGTAWFNNQPDGLVYAGKVAYKYKGTMPTGTHITLEEGTLGIADYAFRDCSGLTSVTIPNSVTSIGVGAFSGCSGLTSVTIPNSVTRIGEYAFSLCSGLTSVTLNANDIVSKTYSSSSNLGTIFGTQVKEYVLGDDVKGIGNYAFYKCSGLTSVTIPNSVTSIGSYAFEGCSGLTSVTIPNSVTSIGSFAFYGCSGLTSIDIPNSVTSIGSSAFSGCSGLTSVTIPNSVTSIGSSAFYNTAWYNNQPDGLIYAGKVAYKYKGTMPSETHITIEEGTLGITEAAFSGCSGLTSVTIPNSVTSISGSAFSGCSGLTSVTIPNSVTSIGEYTFSRCSGLTSVTIPESVTSIGYRAFYDCSGLTSVTLNANDIVSKTYSSSSNLGTIFGTQVKEYVLGDNITAIGDYAFRGCSGLTSVTFGTGLLSIGNYAFGNTKPTKVIWLTNTPPSGYSSAAGIVNYVANNQYASLSNTKVYPFLSSMFEVDGVKYVPVSPSERTCDAIDCSYSNEAENIVIGKIVSFKGINLAVSNVNEYTCYQNPYIKNIILNNIGNICSKAFAGITGEFTAIVNNQGYIAESAFYQSTGLKSLEISGNVKNIGSKAFGGITGEFSAKVNNQGDIGSDAFYQSKGLKSLEIGSNVKNIGSNAFDGFTALQTATINNTGVVGDYAFRGCTALATATLGKNITGIGPSAFQNCSSLQAIIIPDAVTALGAYAFSGCSKMTSAKLGKGIKTIETYTFDGCSSLQDIVIPVGVTTINFCAFRNCSSLQDIIIPDAVTALGSYTFQNCSNMKSVKIGNGVSVIETYTFSGCSKLEVIQIPVGVTAINDYVFSGCNSLRIVIVDEQKSELSLGSNGSSPLFSSCPLDSVYIGRNIIYPAESNKGYSPFYRNTSLRSVKITDGETEISDNEFYGCTNLQNVKIGNGVTKIGKWAFSGCGSIDYFSFGSSVEEIGQEAFSDCTAMTRLISHAPTPPTCGSQALDDINKWECTLSVPSGCIGYYQQANQWKEFFFVDDDADAPAYILGDANGNGVVEIGDVTSVLTLMATPEATGYNNKAADANGNGEIEIGDVTTILTIMAGN